MQYIADTMAATAVRIDVTLPITDDALLDLFREKVASSDNKIKIAVFDTGNQSDGQSQRGRFVHV